MLRNFKFQTTLLLVSILVVLAMIMYMIYQNAGNAALIILIPLFVGLVWRLFSQIDKTNREVASFLANIKYNDYASSFSEKESIGDSYKNLHGAFNMVTKKFRDIRSEKEAQFQYLKAIVENVDTGLICFDDAGKTVLFNRGLQQLLHKSYFPNFKSIELYDQVLYKALELINPGEKKLVKLIIAGQMVQLSIRKTILKIKQDALHLYAIQNIHAELEHQEVESWQKLIRILTHEIMNSITPVVSLSGTTKQLMEDAFPMGPDTQDDVRKAISAINRRSSGLLKFTETYRQLTKVPPPRFKQADPVELLEDVLTLLTPTLRKQGVKVVRHFPKKQILVHLDPDLMEQVFLNIVNNAIHALQEIEKPVLTLHVFTGQEGELEIQIQDNGKGIPEALIDQVFVPFYTTKEEGSGIGLSLSRQIVHMHKGNIFVVSKPDKGTIFTLKI